MQEISGNALLAIAIRAALAAGREILSVYESEDFEVSFKSDDSPLTRADRRAHEAIVARLSVVDGTEHIPILSEEGSEIPFEQRNTWGRFWMVDPLDGTKEFIKRNGEFTVNIALIEQGVPVLGVVYAPVPDKLYFTDVSSGTFLVADTAACTDGAGKPDINELKRWSRKLPLSHGAGHSEVLRVVASRSHMNDDTREFVDRIGQHFQQVELVSAGSSLKLCLVAEGSADLYPRLAPTMEWDTAAAHAVLLGAGAGLVQAGTGDAVLYNKENLLNPHFVAFVPALEHRIRSLSD